MTEPWEPWKRQPPINTYHPRYAELRALAEISNARNSRHELIFDLDKPMAFCLSDVSDYYWWLRGTSLSGEKLCAQWMQARDNGRTDFRADLDQYLGIEATLDPSTALDRILTAEKRRAELLKEKAP